MDKTQFVNRHPAVKRFLSDERELRTIRASDIEARDAGDGGMRIGGHAAVFNTWANIGGWFLERIDPKAFDKTIKEADVRMLFNHNPDQVLARTKNGTLDLSTDKEGLVYDGEINKMDPQAVSVYEKIVRKDVDQSSFAFQVVAEEWRDANEEFDLPQRTIIEAKLFDVSPVTYPAYEETDVGVRAAALGILSSLMGLSERKRAILLRAMEEDIELPDGFAAAVDIISPVIQDLVRSDTSLESEQDSDTEEVEEIEQSEEDVEPVDQAEAPTEDKPAAEEAPEEVEAEGDDDRATRFDRWISRFLKVEGRRPTIDEIEDQFPSRTQETST